LIGSTKTKKGLSMTAVLDKNEYKTGIKVTDKKLSQVNLKGDNFHPEWNYTVIHN
jgi:hypothetical protein